MMFTEAEEPWFPTLADVEAFKVDSADPEYWRKFGWEQLEVPSDCPMISDRMDELRVRFVERFMFRMLNAETMERWQIRLQNRFDEVVHRFERKYELYARFDEDMKEDVLEGERTHTTSKNTSGGEDSSESKSRSTDTPDEAVNDTESYASSRTENKGSTKYGRTDSLEATVTTTITGKGIIQNINESTDNWLDLDTEFISQFENNFINIFWY